MEEEDNPLQLELDEEIDPDLLWDLSEEESSEEETEDDIVRYEPILLPRTSACMLVCGSGFVIKQDLANHLMVKNILSDPEDPRPFLVRNYWKTIKSLSDMDVCESAAKIFAEPNAGGNSVNSEGLSMEVLSQLYGASDVVTEMEVSYWNDNWKKCDYITKILGHRVGVSVTRGMFYPSPDGFTKEDAIHLLHKKLDGLVVARSGIRKRDSFRNSILHIWCETDRIADLITEAWQEASYKLRDNIIVVLTVTTTSPFIFYESLDTSLIAKHRRASASI